MDQDVKGAVLTLLRGRQYIFSLFHLLLGAEPTADIIAAASGQNSLNAVALFAIDGSPAPRTLMEALGGLAHADLGALSDEYTRLFLGPKDLIAPPWESVYRGTERALFQESTLAVRKWYEQYGFEPAQLLRYPDDHISLMMHFLALLCERAVSALEEEKEETYRDAMAAQLLFEQNHLMNWLDAYASDMEKSETNLFYPQFTKAVADMVRYDNALILEIMDGEKE